MAKNWMCREGGGDLIALTSEEIAMPNIIVHVARMVHTPVGITGGPCAVFAACGIYSR